MINILVALLVAYSFNLTQDMINEDKLLDICIYTDIRLDQCNMIYGGKEYGGPIQ